MSDENKEKWKVVVTNKTVNVMCGFTRLFSFVPNEYEARELQNMVDAYNALLAELKEPSSEHGEVALDAREVPAAVEPCPPAQLTKGLSDDVKAVEKEDLGDETPIARGESDARGRMARQKHSNTVIAALYLASKLPTCQGCPDENHEVVVMAMDALKILKEMGWPGISERDESQ